MSVSLFRREGVILVMGSTTPRCFRMRQRLPASYPLVALTKRCSNLQAFLFEVSLMAGRVAKSPLRPFGNNWLFHQAYKRRSSFCLGLRATHFSGFSEPLFRALPPQPGPMRSPGKEALEQLEQPAEQQGGGREWLAVGLSGCRSSIGKDTRGMVSVNNG